MKFKHLLFIFLVGLAVNGCSLVYKPDIKQGNILNPQKVEEIKAGINKDEVIALLGNPVLVNLFNDHEMIYVYTIQPAHAPFKAEQLRIYFENGVVTRHVFTH